MMEAKERDSQAVPYTVVRSQAKTDGTLPPYTVQAKRVDRNVGDHR